MRNRISVIKAMMFAIVLTGMNAAAQRVDQTQAASGQGRSSASSASSGRANWFVLGNIAGKLIAEGELKSTPGPQGANPTAQIYETSVGAERTVPMANILRIEHSPKRGTAGKCVDRPMAKVVLKEREIEGCFVYSMWVEQADGTKTSLDRVDSTVVLRRR